MKKSFIYTIFLIFILLSGILNWATMKESILLDKVEENLRFRGIVEKVNWKEEDGSKYVIKVTNIIDEERVHKVNERMALKIIGEKDLELGDKIIFHGKTKKPLGNTNPKLFNYKLSLLSDKIYTTMTIKDYSIVQINRENVGFKYRLRTKFREEVEVLFNRHLNEPNSSLMKSIVLGQYSYLEDEDVSKYRDLGLAHILAVSGLHIGIIAMFLVFLLSHLGIMRKWVYSITLSTIWFYGFLIGFPPSLLRANIMMSIVFAARTLAEPYDSINSLFISMVILLIINPFWIFKVGFQLSYLATGSIIYFTPRIQNGFYPYKNRITYGLCGILGVQIGLLPLQAYYFNEIPIVTILSNLLIAPILSLGLVLGGSMVVVFYSFSSLNMVLGLILNMVLGLQFKLVEILHKIPYGKISVHSPSLSEIILYYIFILILLKIIDVNKLKIRIKKTIIYSLLFYIVSTSIWIMNDKSIEMDFIDVGQGDSILIRSRNGNYLVDTGGNVTGSFDVGENITLPYLRKHGVRRIKGVFITHFHEDHCKSLPLLVDKLNIDKVLISYRNPKSEAYNYIMEKNLPFSILTEGDKLSLDKDLSLEVLSPNKEFINRNLEENDLSLVFLLRYYNRRILFTGDMEKEVEGYLLDKFHQPIDIIKVPHHGSNTSSSEELLNVIKPKVGIVTVGRSNFYGHPRQEVINRYRDIGTQIYRTDEMGMVKVKLNKDNMEIRSFLRDEINLYGLLNDYILVWVYYLLYYLISYILVKTYIFTEEEELSLIEL